MLRLSRGLVLPVRKIFSNNLKLGKAYLNIFRGKDDVVGFILPAPKWLFARKESTLTEQFGAVL